MLRSLVLVLVVLVAACATDPLARLAQAETDFRNAVNVANDARRPCVEFGEDHPGCIIKADVYPLVLAAIEEGDALLDDYGDAVRAGDTLTADAYARSVLKVIERLTLYSATRR